ncbi:MAG TPA: methyltransferase domain-containing protein, partial [Chryseosolibacter sp.]|nr:methyltransferase domain-containing protein [Chryseosolibacter sp.]
MASHENDDVHELVLKNKFIHGVPAALVVRQIVGRNKAKTKLPSFYRNERIVYPPSLSLEQSSSEQTAAHKASFVGETISESVCGVGADLTGGLGVDTLYLSRLFKTFHFVEPNADLIEIAKHNLRELGARNVVFHNATAETFLASLDRSFDFVYVDPSRRTEGDNRLVTLADCQPNIVSLQDRLLATAPNVLVKTSPLLDIQRGLAQLREVAS